MIEPAIYVVYAVVPGAICARCCSFLWFCVTLLYFWLLHLSMQLIFTWTVLTDFFCIAPRMQPLRLRTDQLFLKSVVREQDLDIGLPHFCSFLLFTTWALENSVVNYKILGSNFDVITFSMQATEFPCRPLRERFRFGKRSILFTIENLRCFKFGKRSVLFTIEMSRFGKSSDWDVLGSVRVRFC
jgi:hypothetical protein